MSKRNCPRSLRWRSCGGGRESRKRRGSLLDEVWEAAGRGPYPLIHADGCNVLAEVEREEGNREAAIEAATEGVRVGVV